MASSRWNFDDPRFQDRMDKALEETLDLQAKWPPTPRGEYIEYQRRGKKHPNRAAYEKARAKIWVKHLRGTGWAEDEIDDELEKRFDSVRKTAEAADCWSDYKAGDREITPEGRQVMASRKKTAGVVSTDYGFDDTESYEVKGTGRKGLTLTPITFALDDWEYIGEDGGVEVSWGSNKALMDRREFAAFAADMKKAIAWAERYDYSKGRLASGSRKASARRVAGRHIGRAGGE